MSTPKSLQQQQQQTGSAAPSPSQASLLLSGSLLFNADPLSAVLPQSANMDSELPLPTASTSQPMELPLHTAFKSDAGDLLVLDQVVNFATHVDFSLPEDSTVHSTNSTHSFNDVNYPTSESDGESTTGRSPVNSTLTGSPLPDADDDLFRTHNNNQPNHFANNHSNINSNINSNNPLASFEGFPALNPLPTTSFLAPTLIPTMGTASVTSSSSSSSSGGAATSPTPAAASSATTTAGTATAAAPAPAPAAGRKGRKRKSKIVELPEEDDNSEEGDNRHLGKRERNKMSAAKYRKRRKMYVQTLENKVNQLEEKMCKQTDTLTNLETENRVMREQITFLKKLLGMRGPNVPNLDTPTVAAAKKAGLVMFAFFACFLMCTPLWNPALDTTASPAFSTPAYSSSSSSPSAFDPSVQGHRGRVLLCKGDDCACECALPSGDVAASNALPHYAWNKNLTEHSASTAFFAALQDAHTHLHGDAALWNHMVMASA